MIVLESAPVLPEAPHVEWSVIVLYPVIYPGLNGGAAMATDLRTRAAIFRPGGSSGRRGDDRELWWRFLAASSRAARANRMPAAPRGVCSALLGVAEALAVRFGDYRRSGKSAHISPRAGIPDSI